MVMARGTMWIRVTIAIAVGAIIGAVALNVWTQGFRYRGLAEERWDPRKAESSYAGSVSCRECHERFYKLWAPSHHGRAMQPVTAAFVKESLPPLAEPITIGASQFSVDLDQQQVIEEKDGKRTAYPMLHAMGGKNVFFFLTPLDRGRLQVLPLSYDVRREEWFDTTGSMVRHFSEEPDSAIDWRDPLLTFNTACYNCHVSQLDKNYDASTNTYHTTWREPGINCEACHGPGEEHNRVCREVPKGTVPRDIKTVRWGDFTRQQTNDACAPCHAKMRQITPTFMPGDRFFDHHDLVCLEDRDFYPDGRDLGENYTQTAWLMNPCAQSGMLDCIDCHTSSGRFRQEEAPSTSCLPCHAQRVRKPETHSHHPNGPQTPTCVSCHLPMTEFSRMKRSDHSFRPPCPEASIRFKSPNACVLCHTDKTNDWAAAKVKAWHPTSHWREKILLEGALVDAARKRDWGRLPEMIAHIRSSSSESVVVTSLVRLLASCPRPEKWAAIRQCIKHASPLVRGAAAGALADDLQTPGSAEELLQALHDDVRLVRVRSVVALARYPREAIAPEHLVALKKAEEEALASFSAQPDAWHSHYNRGNYRSARGDQKAALAAYKQAIALRSDIVQPYVNASVISSQLGDLSASVSFLRKAHQAAPEHGAVNFNLGLALAEKGDKKGAEKHLRLAVKVEDTRAQAAYNLAVLVAGRDENEAIRLCRIAAKSDPGNARYAYTLAFYLAGRFPTEATGILEALIARHRSYADAWILLGRCYETTGNGKAASQHYLAMEKEPALPAEVRKLAGTRLTAVPKGQ
ncbi:MAG: tetratricopeptide repeat protein [Lentisphaerae bacterium]|jgi:tetratricopeptide (TPR) repeat protein|nr:tetratricopeptide repeat protein [Lentisphaerota bacterium]MBT4820660.1 tetratricopeptide repeat protein [Lentisphaerota bacterium]MBT5611093.1 tetratricopeptide repeat protein [Lentisphaerota bacterium]MBT7055635.1 tetratricopeptide repeat protein [Lentisphaerota bacterium]MBT7846583.1 tetratricopeptide repeat protein [Lentisphaerota bacterium]